MAVARRVHNGLVDKHPAMIARCRGVADVCRATIDGGLMIDLSPMKGIHVDSRARLARAQGGVLWTEFNRETQVHGLATTGGENADLFRAIRGGGGNFGIAAS